MFEPAVREWLINCLTNWRVSGLIELKDRELKEALTCLSREGMTGYVNMEDAILLDCFWEDAENFLHMDLEELKTDADWVAFIIHRAMLDKVTRV